jgi:hypothetical protein
MAKPQAVDGHRTNFMNGFDFNRECIPAPAAWIAVRCRRASFRFLAALSRIPEPVDVWLHPDDRLWRAVFERLPNVRRVFFSPLADATRRCGSERRSCVPVFGRYEDVVDLESHVSV